MNVTNVTNEVYKNDALLPEKEEIDALAYAASWELNGYDEATENDERKPLDFGD